MKKFLKKLAIASMLISIGFGAASFVDNPNKVKATVTSSSQWNIEEVQRHGGFTVSLMTDPDTNIQYIVVYRFNADAGTAIAITPRLITRP